MGQKEFIQEVSIALNRNGYVVMHEPDNQLSVELDRQPLCRIDENVNIRYSQSDIHSAEQEQALEKLVASVGEVREYMTLMRQAPKLEAQGLSGDYRLLSEFNGTVFAGHPTKCGVQFVTWDWDFNHVGLNQGHYYQTDYAKAKRDFATRSGLISNQQLFSPDQLTEIYRCVSEPLDGCMDMTQQRWRMLTSISEQIEACVPDLEDRVTQSTELEMNM